MSFFDFNGGAQSFGFPEQQAQEMPFPDGAPMWAGGMQNMSMQQPMQSPFGGSQLPGTGAPQIAPNAPQKPFDPAISDLSSLEQRQLAEAQAAKDAEEMKRSQAVGASFRDKGLGAQAKDMGDGGMMSLMNMAKGRSGQPQFQDVMQGPQMQLPRGLL